MLLNTRIPLKFIVRKVKTDMAIVVAFVSFIIFTKEFLEFNYHIPIAVPSFLGTAITLVLAFKINQSYDRWWEARKIWGAIVNDSRTFVLQLKAYCQNSDTFSCDNTVKRMSYRQIAWSYALSDALRKKTPCGQIDGFLSRNELEELKTHANVPLKIADMNMQDLKEMLKSKSLELFHQIRIEETIERLVASMGKAERIKNTVFPTTYLIFLKGFLYTFLVILDLALQGLQPWVEMGLLFFIALPFFLLMKTALFLQDPFEDRETDIPTETISRTIELNIKQLLNDSNLPEMKKPDTFYIK